MTDTDPNHADPIEARWLVWGRSVFAVTVVAMLVALGIANVSMYSRWHEVEDGVLWSGRAEGVTAAEIADGTAAAAAGIARGDVLLAVNGSPIQAPSDVVEYQHRGHAGTRLVYTLLRAGVRQPIELVLAPAPRGNSMYFVLAAVGLFTLIVGGRRCISSGCASRSSASSPSRSTARSIASTGRSTGVTRSRSPCCRRCCSTSRWCSRSVRTKGSARHAPIGSTRCSCR
jgi:hypothetical protein